MKPMDLSQNNVSQPVNTQDYKKRKKEKKKKPKYAAIKLKYFKVF